MRTIHKSEQKKRGCQYCADKMSKKTKQCPYDECPYHELDGFNSYNDFMKAKGNTTMAAVLKKLQNL